MRLSPWSQDNGFHLELDHFIDYLRPVLVGASENSTQLDYPKIAAEYLRDVNRLRTELESAALPEAEREAYSGYLIECKQLIEYLGSLPVPPEGHLGFRKHAVEAFQFLIDDYGYELLEAEPIEVRFASGKVSVKISYWPQTPQGSIDIQARDGGDRTTEFFLDHFAFVAGLGLTFDYRRFDLRSPVGLSEFLRAAAALVRRHGDGVLRATAMQYGNSKARLRNASASILKQWNTNTRRSEGHMGPRCAEPEHDQKLFRWNAGRDLLPENSAKTAYDLNVLDGKMKNRNSQKSR